MDDKEKELAELRAKVNDWEKVAKEEAAQKASLKIALEEKEEQMKALQLAAEAKKPEEIFNDITSRWRKEIEDAQKNN